MLAKQLQPLVLTLLASGLVFMASSSQVSAQTRERRITIPEATPVATSEAELNASPSATPVVSSASAAVTQLIEEKKDTDITNSTGQQKSKLAAFLDENPLGPLSWNNGLQHALRATISRGVPANIVVLVLLFPVIASLISFSRHIIGMKGFGIYTPAVLSVAFVSTGIVNGIVLFLIVLAASILSRRIVKKMNLQYLPRTAMLFWGVSLVMLLVLFGLSYIPLAFVSSLIAGLNIFPILIIILLSENFIESQLLSSQSEATRLTMETLVTAILCSLLIGSETIQQWVMLQPELTLIIVAAFNIAVGRYTGLRLLEWVRFRSIIDE